MDLSLLSVRTEVSDVANVQCVCHLKFLNHLMSRQKSESSKI